MDCSIPGFLVLHHFLRACSNSCSLSQWHHLIIPSSVIPFSSCLQSFPESGSFPLNRLFTSGGQSIGASASASVLPMNTQDWSSLGWTGLISLQSKGLSRVFSNITVQKHPFLSAQPSLCSNPHIHTWLWENHSFISPFFGKLMSLLYNTLSRFVIQVLKFWLFNICLLIALETLLIETKSREMAS